MFEEPQRGAQRMVAKVAALGLCFGLSSCKSDACPNFPMFGPATIASVEPVAEGTEVVVTWKRHPDDELAADYYAKSMSLIGEPSGVTAEVTGDREITVVYAADPVTGESDPRDAALEFRIGGCQYQDEHYVTLSLAFDPESAAFSEIETNYGSCITISPGGASRSAWPLGLAAFAALLVGVRRRRRAPRRDAQIT